MTRLTVGIRGVGLLGPGMASWAASRDMLAGRGVHLPCPTPLPTPQRLPAAERRRAGAAIKLALAVGDEAVGQAGIDPQTLATVFTSSSGEGANCHALCEALASADRSISPTRFTNSVHNAAAGHWHIAVASRAASTSLCAFDASFAAGLLEAATQILVSGKPVLLVAIDMPYPEPLHSVRPLPDNFGLALVLAPAHDGNALGLLHLSLGETDPQLPATPCRTASLEALRAAIPAACGLPVLEALAEPARERSLVLTCPPGMSLRVDLTTEQR